MKSTHDREAQFASLLDEYSGMLSFCLFSELGC